MTKNTDFEKSLDELEKIVEELQNGEISLDILMITKYFERIGDHATNIAEWVLFSITGEHFDK